MLHHLWYIVTYLFFYLFIFLKNLGTIHLACNIFLLRVMILTRCKTSARKILESHLSMEFLSMQNHFSRSPPKSSSLKIWYYVDMFFFYLLFLMIVIKQVLGATEFFFNYFISLSANVVGSKQPIITVWTRTGRNIGRCTTRVCQVCDKTVFYSFSNSLPSHLIPRTRTY